MFQINEENIAGKAWTDTVEVTVCALKFRRSYCGTAADLVLAAPANPATPDGIETVIVNDLILVIDWNNPSEEAGCNVTEYFVYILGIDGSTYTQETTYCDIELVVENNVCSMPIGVVTAAPYSLTSGTVIKVQIKA
jgi:hypothetical protein